MEFDTTTFILEFINFLILIWILQRLFYQPVLQIIAKRKQTIDQSLEDAKKLQQEADDLRTQYENRQQLWEQEKAKAQAGLREQFDSERVKQLEQLNQELDQKREQAGLAVAQQQAEFQRQAELQALKNGAQFAGLLLTLVAGPELETRLLTLLTEQSATFPFDGFANKSGQALDAATAIKITSAYPIDDDLKRELEQKFAPLNETASHFQYTQDSALLAGIRVEFGAWVMQFNLQHELGGFTELSYANRQSR